MFDIGCVKPIPYVDPWALTYEKRLTQLVSRPTRIAYYYERPDTSTFRYRVYNMVNAITANKRCGVSASWFHREDIDRSFDFVDRCDVLVIARTRISPAVDRMIARARRRGIRVLFDVDDMVFDESYAFLILDTLAQNAESEPALDGWYAYFSRIGATLKQCDGVITTNTFLAKKIREYHPHGYTRVIPNFLNHDQQCISTLLYEEKKTKHFTSTGPWHIGYFSGSPTHVRDFAVAAPAIRSIMDTCPQIRLTLVGFMDLDSSFDRLAGRIIRHPLQDFLNLQRLIAEVEINIAPLQDNDFTNCKSELKYFEAAAVGTVTIATPTHTFSNSITDERNGLLATTQAWEQKLTRAMELLEDREAYEAMADHGWRHAIESYGWDNFSEAILTAVLGR